MENGQVNATLKTIGILADALGVEYWRLIKPAEEKQWLNDEEKPGWKLKGG
jgi:hypothetical protein